MNVQILFYKDSNGTNIPVSVSSVLSPENVLPSRDEKEAIHKQWPQSKGNLFLLFQGHVFDLNSY